MGGVRLSGLLLCVEGVLDKRKNDVGERSAFPAVTANSNQRTRGQNDSCKATAPSATLSAIRSVGWMMACWPTPAVDY